MSNLWINIRLLYWHLQIEDRWKGKWSVSFNNVHWGNRLEDGWFEVYHWKGKYIKKNKD